jgi:hypothetical protein
MRQAAVSENDVQRMAAWAGQSAALARAEPAANSSAVFGTKPRHSYHERRSGSPRHGMMIAQSLNREISLARSFRRLAAQIHRTARKSSWVPAELAGIP